MLVTQKCQYALRALMALARCDPQRPVKIAQIAEDQGIPYRFLEVILGQLKQGGFVDSRRGNEGGYLLACPPERIEVGRVVRFIDGPLLPEETPPPEGTATSDVVAALWKRVEAAVNDVVDRTTIADLVAQEDALRGDMAVNFVI